MDVGGGESPSGGINGEGTKLGGHHGDNLLDMGQLFLSAERCKNTRKFNEDNKSKPLFYC